MTSPDARTAVLLVEDNEDFALGLQLMLRSEGYALAHVTTRAQAVERLRSGALFAAALVDLSLPDASGLTVLEALQAAQPGCALIVITGRDDAELAVEALRLGAFDYLTKPVRRAQLLDTLGAALRSREARLGVEARRRSPDTTAQPVLGDSPAWRRTLETLDAAANANITVLLTGESGSGKEVAARLVHRSSPKRDAPFVAVNVAALPETLIESEFFGHESGAFTGARHVRRGCFELTGDGTLFLDEIGDMPLHLQAKLLRVLEGHTFQRLGGERAMAFEGRLISATNRPLAEWVQAGRFRADLYHRLRVLEIRLPPLRERDGDIERLALHFLVRLAAEQGLRQPHLTAEALDALRGYRWPGNVRELRNVIERALVLSRGGPILPRHLPPEIAPSAFAPSPSAPIPPTQPIAPSHHTARLSPDEDLSLEAAICRHICDVIRLCDGNITHASEALGITRQTLRRRLKKCDCAAD